MNKIHKLIVYFISLILCIFLTIGIWTFLSSWSVLFRSILGIITFLGMLLMTIFLLLKKDALYKSTFIMIIFGFTVFVSLFIANSALNLSDKSSDEEKLDAIVNMIRNSGEWGMLVFILLQIIQVVILPMPALLCYISGIQIWSPLTATILASIGVIIGSIIDYLIGRIFGVKVLKWIVGEDKIDKYTNLIGKKSKFTFAMMEILPFFPDDILCMFAGLGKMNFAYFSFVIVVFRPLLVAAYCYLGSGTIIPFSGWGIIVWIIIGVVAIFLAIISYFYQEKFENWILSLGKRFKKEAEDN